MGIPIKHNDNISKIKVNFKKGHNMTSTANNNNNNCACSESKPDKFKLMNENKSDKSKRNNELLNAALARAQKGDFDEDIESQAGMDLLKVYERFSIHEQFSLEKGKPYFKLYKEVFYMNDPHKRYYDTVEDKVYRRIAAQHEEGDEEWAKAVAKELKIEIVKKA